eukprot:GAFH01001985.1.p2 GENE.GAFH01001985.1~~GAFH01001985.1.p2  ORF type:complete len:150 (+),score=55.48 GAFH01001985.1:534-983(+)
MRALLPASAFEGLGKTSLKDLQLMNVKELDDHRAALVDLLNLARAAIAQMRPNTEIVDAYEAVLAALRQGFQAEERLMASHDAPHQRSHRRDHQRFIKLYEGPLEALRDASSGALDQVLAVLSDNSVLLVHGPQMDIPLGRYLNRRGVY